MISSGLRHQRSVHTSVPDSDTHVRSRVKHATRRAGGVPRRRSKSGLGAPRHPAAHFGRHPPSELRRSVLISQAGTFKLVGTRKEGRFLRHPEGMPRLLCTVRWWLGVRHLCSPSSLLRLKRAPVSAAQWAGSVFNRPHRGSHTALSPHNTQPTRSRPRLAVKAEPEPARPGRSPCALARPPSAASASSQVASHRSAERPGSAHARQRAPLVGDRVVALHARMPHSAL